MVYKRTKHTEINIFIQNMAKTHAHKITRTHAHTHTHTEDCMHTMQIKSTHTHTPAHTHTWLRRTWGGVQGGGLKTNLKAWAVIKSKREKKSPYHCSLHHPIHTPKSCRPCRSSHHVSSWMDSLHCSWELATSGTTAHRNNENVLQFMTNHTTMLYHVCVLINKRSFEPFMCFNHATVPDSMSFSSHPTHTHKKRNPPSPPPPNMHTTHTHTHNHTYNHNLRLCLRSPSNSQGSCAQTILLP